MAEPKPNANHLHFTGACMVIRRSGLEELVTTVRARHRLPRPSVLPQYWTDLGDWAQTGLAMRRLKRVEGVEGTLLQERY
jgi:hypothetical protein